MIGSRIKQARLLAGMTQRELAKALGEAGYKITAAAISKYEKNKSYPTAQFLLLASAVLGVPSTYFTHQPVTQVQWTAFRRHRGFGKKKQEAVKTYASDLAELQIELHSLFYPEASPDLPTPIEAKTYNDAEKIAERVRASWDVGNRPLDNLVQTAEDRGIIVISWDDDSGKFDGLSGWCGEYPVTVINNGRSPDRKRFNLAHEIGHLVMDTSQANEDDESLAHRFAAALLVPAEHALRELGRERRHLDWGELMMLKRKYGLSMAAWVTRAKDLGIITENCYRMHFADLSRLGWHKLEPVEYEGDEEPILLKQMARRAVAEGLMDPDVIAHWVPDSIEPDTELMPKGAFPSATELLAMEESKRDRWVSQMFEWAENEDFEVFEAYGEEEF